MTTGLAERLRNATPDKGDVLDHLALAYSENLDRHGPLPGVADVAAPTEVRAFEAEAVRKGLLIDSATAPIEKAAALFDKEAHRHEQIGRLAIYLAAYEVAHGDPHDAAPLRELGRDHLGLAEDLRGKIERGRPEPLTLDTIKRDPMAAVTLPIPQDANASLLRGIEQVAAEIATAKLVEMEGIKSGVIAAPAWAGRPDAPDAHEVAEAAYLQAAARQEEATARLNERQQPGLVRDFVTAVVLADSRAERTNEQKPYFGLKL